MDLGAGLLLLVLGTGLLPAARAEEPADPSKSPAVCGSGDNPEPGIQGAVPSGTTPSFECGISVVGVLPGASGPLTKAGTCAYTGGGGGVRVIDVSDPSNPEQVDLLDTSYRENLSVAVTPERAVLATRHRDTDALADQVVGRDMFVDIWDIRNCTSPIKLGTLRFPTDGKTIGDPPAETGGPVHNITLNPSGTKVYGVMPLTEGDITDLYNPQNWTVRDVQCEVETQHHIQYTVPAVCDATEGQVWRSAGHHQAVFNPSGSRMYIGGLVHGYDDNEILIVDMESEDPEYKVLGWSDPENPGHDINYAKIDGTEYLLHSAEITNPSAGCIPTEVRPTGVGYGDRAFLMDITGDGTFKRKSTLELAVNKVENCGNGSSAGVHYHGVDDPENTTFAMISWTTAGLRVWDVRDPASPKEVAYFNHGSSGTDPWYDAETGHIWLSAGGHFWVLELEAHVRAALGLE